MKKYKNYIIAGIIIILALLITFWWGGNAPTLHGWTTNTKTAEHNEKKLTAEEKIAIAKEKATAVEEEAEQPSEEKSIEEKETPKEETKSEDLPPQEQSSDEEVTNQQPQEIFVEETAPVVSTPDVEKEENICTLSVRCDTILNNMDYLTPSKRSIVPSNGIILAETAVTFNEGETVFDVLKRQLKERGIHLEFVSAPMYNSMYIEGIANLYEFDCGELSGWMYRVNGWFPNYGCSGYTLKDGDKIEWIYTCDLGVDIGGFQATGNNQ